MDVQKENKESNNEDDSGDASIELDEAPYKEWLAMQGIVKSQSENICKIEKKSDNESELVTDDSKDDDQTSEVGGDHDSKVMISTIDKMKGEVKELLAKGNAEAKTKAKIKKLKSILQLLEDNKDEDDSDEPDLEMAKGQQKKIKDEAAHKKIKENECKKKDEVKRQEQLQVQMSEEDEQKKIQEIMKKQKAEIESKKEKEKQDFIEKERIACKKQKEELSKKRPEEHKQMKAKM